jgi:transcriptional regulator with XRE-family HTH domain
MASKALRVKKQRKSKKALQPASDAAYVTGSGAPPTRERNLERAIGAEVKALRLRNELSIADLANAANISPGMLSKIENGQISPSLGTLQSLGAALNIPLTALFSSFEDNRDCSYVRSGQGLVIERRGTKVGHQYQLLGQTLGREVVVEPYLITLQEDAVPYIGFQHTGVEFIYMLSGEVVYRHSDKKYPLKRGDSLLFDARAIHGPEILITRPCTYLSVIMYPGSGR